jgi:hypothetical protein
VPPPQFVAHEPLLRVRYFLGIPVQAQADAFARVHIMTIGDPNMPAAKLLFEINYSAGFSGELFGILRKLQRLDKRLDISIEYLVKIIDR